MGSISQQLPKIMLRVCLLLPILLLAGAPLSRAEEEDQEVSWFQDMMALKRANPEDSPTFFAVRGKKNVLKPNSLFGALSGKRFARSMKPNSLFSAIPGRRSPMGKRSMKPNSLFSAIPAGKRGGFNSLKPNSLFGSFSKRSIKPNGLFGLRVQRDTEPMDLFSVGKKNSFLVCGPEDTRCFKWNMPPMFGVLKRSSLDPEEETFVIDLEDDEEDLAERMKRGADVGDFWATRGKRDSADFDFWATRGKREAGATLAEN